MEGTTTQQHNLRTKLQRCAVPATPWFAFVDAAQDDSIPGRARDAGLSVQSLYSGERGAKLEHVAPHLTTFDPGGEFAAWLFDHWEGNHGILLQSSASFETLRKHLKRFLMVKTEGGKKYRLRYYDPRVLRAFVPACTSTELKEFFGPVACYYAAGRGGKSVWAYAWSLKGLTAREYPIGQPETPGTGPTGSDGSRATGSLLVALIDADSGMPLSGASVQVDGPVTQQAVTGEWGDTRFSRLTVGTYQIYAIDPQHRMGNGTVTVTESGAQIQLTCRAAPT